MNGLFKEFSFSKLFALAILLSVLGVALLLGVVLTRGMDQSFEQQTQHLNRLHLDRVAQQLRQFTQSHLTVLADIAANPLTIQGVLQPETNLANTMDWLASVRLIGERYPLVLMDFEGKVLHQTAKNGPLDTSSVQSVLQGVQPHMQYVHAQEDGNHQLWLITPVLWQQGAEGALAVCIPLDRLEPLEHKQSGQGGIRLWQDKRLLLSIGQPGQGQSTQKILGEVGITLEMVMDNMALQQARGQLVWDTLLLGLLLLVLLGAMLYMWGQKLLVAPLVGLSRQAEAIAKGVDPDPIEQKPGVQEITQLTHKFHHMYQEVTATRQHLEKLVGERTQALENQLQERIRAEETLRVVSDLQEAILESADAMIIATDATGRIIQFNTAAQRKLGFEAHEVLGHMKLDALHDAMELQNRHLPIHIESDQPLSIPLLTILYRASQGEVDEREWCYRCKDGRTFPVRLSITQVHNHGNHVQQGYLVVGLDITELKASQQALMRNQANLAHAQAIAHLGSWQWELGSGHMFWSDETFRIFGEALQSFKPAFEDILRRTHPQDAKFLEQGVTRSLADPEVGFEFETRLLRRSGEVRSVIMLGEVAYDHNRKPLRVSGTIQDITERKITEDNLLLAKRVIESASEAIVITNAEGLITDINPAYEAITGYSREEVMGQSPAITQSGRHDEGFYKQMWQALKQAGSWEGEIWDRRKNGEIFPKWLTINAMRNAYGHVSHYVGIFLDITTQKATEEKLERLAFYDPLTKLPNRALFRDRLEHELEISARDQDQTGLFFIDLDRFKLVNDTLGHDAGDLLLQSVSERIRETLRRSDTVARLGGDEFTVILPRIHQPAEAAKIAQNIIESLKQPFQLKSQEVFIGSSIGIALYPEDGEDFETLTKNADTAMYQAKEAGRGQYIFFTQDMNRHNHQRMNMERDLRYALTEQQFQLHYQPKLSLSQGQMVGMEALIRWQHPEQGLIGPDQFIPLAEETGLILPMGIWILQTACQQTQQWRTEGHPSLRVAVNLSARQFQDPNLVANIEQALHSSGLQADGLELEITESIAMQDAEQTIETVQQLRHLGLHISIDDFGTGYSSLSYLKRFPLNALKIDRSFIQDVTTSVEDASIVTSIISMAQAMKLDVVAEGVEQDAQLAFLRDLQCGEVQGFLFSRPLDRQQFQTYLKDHPTP
ncbi:sensor domain-containing protein [Magnetococcus sp. PR-3]|uniref:sensor domain-containing protein n=1 Tax=Magnetococcus sp. PR-3 TaxID=3120355 RepID=UPI002FCDEE0D